MIAVTWDNNAGAGALTMTPAGLAQDDGLGTCILISLFTDRRVTAEEAAAAGTDQRGWVGDALADDPTDRTGSRLHLLRREKATEETRSRAVDYTDEALDWMRTDGLVTALEVEAEWVAEEMLGIRIAWTAPDGSRDVMVVPLRVGAA